MIGKSKDSKSNGLIPLIIVIVIIVINVNIMGGSKMFNKANIDSVKSTVGFLFSPNIKEVKKPVYKDDNGFTQAYVNDNPISLGEAAEYNIFNFMIKIKIVFWVLLGIIITLKIWNVFKKRRLLKAKEIID